MSSTDNISLSSSNSSTRDSSGDGGVTKDSNVPVNVDTKVDLDNITLADDRGFGFEGTEVTNTVVDGDTGGEGNGLRGG